MYSLRSLKSVLKFLMLVFIKHRVFTRIQLNIITYRDEVEEYYTGLWTSLLYKKLDCLTGSVTWKNQLDAHCQLKEVAVSCINETNTNLFTLQIHPHAPPTHMER